MPFDEHNTTELDETSLTLLRAADYIREHGWCQRYLTTDGGRVCARGAIIGAVHNEVGFWDMFGTKWDARCQEADKRLAASLSNYGPPETRVPAWNNAYARTKEEVIAALEAAAYGDTK